MFHLVNKVNKIGFYIAYCTECCISFIFFGDKMRVIYLITALVIIITAGFYLKTKKKIIALFGLIIGLFTSQGCIKEKASDAQQNGNTQSNNTKQNAVQTKEEKLLNSEQWKNLSKMWKRMNNFDAEIKSLNNDYDEIGNHTSKLQSEVAKVLSNLIILKNKNLITDLESEGLSIYFQEKAADLSKTYRNYGVMCYRQPAPTEEEKMWNDFHQQDFEKQQQLLEQFLKQGKINKKVYDTTKITIENEKRKNDIKQNPQVLKLITKLRQN